MRERGIGSGVRARWRLIELEGDTAGLAQKCGIQEATARVLLARGIGQAGSAMAFLHPSEGSLAPYDVLPDAGAAIERIARAVDVGEKILVHGDYDVDGLTATALFVRTLRALGADVVPQIPHRQRDGYGLRVATIEGMRGAGIGLIVTVDCGTGAFKEVELASRLGIDVVVTDHHALPTPRDEAVRDAAGAVESTGSLRTPSARLPDAVAVVNPKRLVLEPAPASDHAQLGALLDLAGVGVAFKVCEGVVSRLGSNLDSYREAFLDLVALGTVADAVPLTGENRALVKLGLPRLAATKKPGLRALAEAQRIDLAQVDSRDIAFGLAPPLNAAGRLDDATLALDLLLTKDEIEAGALADELHDKNDERRAEQQSTFAEAVEMIEASGLRDSDMAYVLWSKHWHPGVIGIVASKLVDEYLRPVFMVRSDESGFARGSARSPERVSEYTGRGFDVVEALTQSSDLLTEFGGHARAGGFGLPVANLEAFSERIRSIAADVYRPEDLYRALRIDTHLGAGEITWQLAKELRQLAPFGEANPEPLFVAEPMEVRSKSLMGVGEHVRLKLAHEGTAAVDGVGFGMSGDAVDLAPGDRVAVCFCLDVHAYEGLERAQMIIRDLRRL
jgi:single-stranded-DNA-specific exonuclease